MKPLVINDEAADELNEAILYYETKSPGIGLSLAAGVSEAFKRIQRSPQLYPFHKDTNVQFVSSGRTRRDPQITPSTTSGVRTDGLGLREVM